MSEHADAGPVLSAADYRRLRRATETHREELVVRLAGEVGLTPAELTRVRPGDVSTRERDGDTHHVLAVPDDDGGTARYAYLPADVEHDLRQYASTAGVDADEPVVDVSPRRVQMLVAEVGERAAGRTDSPGLQEVSTRTLRAHFARRLLADEDVDPRVVAAVGGWQRLASLDPYVSLSGVDRARIVDAFADTEHAPASRSDSDTRARGRFDAAVDALHRVSQALADASTREAVETAACDALAASGAYEAAWLVTPTTGVLAVTGAAGGPDPAVELRGAIQAVVDDQAVRTTGDVHGDDAFESWRDHADAVGYDAAAAVPVTDGERLHAVLGVGADASGVDDRERRVLEIAGERIGAAVSLAEQRKLMLADTVIEVAFEAGRDSFFARAAARHDCEFAFEGVVPGEHGTLVCFAELTGASPSTVLSWATDQSPVADARLVRDYGDGALVELVLAGGDLATELAARGASVRDLTADAGGERVVADLPPDADVRDVADGLAASFADLELASKRERERAGEPSTAFRASLRDSLTDKQTAALRAAFHAGYFEWPRGSTAEELADAIGVTSPTLHNHLRRAQQKLLTAFFEDAPAPDGDAPWPED